MKKIKIGDVIEKNLNIKEPLKLDIFGIEIAFPSRLNAMAIDPSLIFPNDKNLYTAGEIIFSIKLFRTVKIKKINTKNELEISERTKRRNLVKHAVLIMKKIINFEDGLFIDVDNQNEIKHAGLGSSSGLISSVAISINELYGSPIDRNYLIKFLAQNHGEEIENEPDFLSPVQCLGGSTAASLYEFGMAVIAGENTVIAGVKISNEYKAIIGIPRDYKPLDAEKMFELEIENIDNFLNTGKIYGKEIAYNVLHFLLPAMFNNDLKTIGDVIFDYRFKKGSIKNCSFAFPDLVEITNNLSFLKTENIVDILSISSVGPGIFAITKNYDLCKKYFEDQKLNTFIVEIHNDGFIVNLKKTVNYN